ncbi:hypothetical protein CDL15_Pgr012187 [Punica granatum]|uniref:Amino acid transporter transmembrane domain-containing protein n=1 Tax=Punica granatum TaxID=22663 RepID=A0A218XLR5_PUNGR|nr:hypothetical protein CDL15_Pgr012187 [Punica granatum]
MRGEVIEEVDLSSSLFNHSDSSDLRKRTGTKWTAVAHIIAGVVGEGVLSLAWRVAQLDWILGPLCIVHFSAITLISATLLAD